MTTIGNRHDLPHVGIIGAGFGGLSAATKLARAPAHVIIFATVIGRGLRLQWLAMRRALLFTEFVSSCAFAAN